MILFRDCKVCGTAYRFKMSQSGRTSYCSRTCMAKDYATRLRGSANPHFSDASKRICRTPIRTRTLLTGGIWTRAPEPTKPRYVYPACDVDVDIPDA